MEPGDIAKVVQGKGTKTLWEGESALIVRQVPREWIAETSDCKETDWYEVLIDGKLKKMRSDYLEEMKK